MRVVATSTLRRFWENHPAAEQPLRAWVRVISRAQWTQPADIKAAFRTASILEKCRVVFNIKGNQFRLVVSVAYPSQIVFVKFVGTHAEYDRIDALTVQPND